MYGSDWLMLRQVPGWQAYADGREGHQGRRPEQVHSRPKVLGANVLECYGLAENSMRQNMQRLTNYYSTWQELTRLAYARSLASVTTGPNGNSTSVA